MSEIRCLRCIVSGRVQGVWFRASTRDKAVELGLNGSARNLPDGRVEVVACGEAIALERLTVWLWQGPPAARVDNVTCEEVSRETYSGFSTG